MVPPLKRPVEMVTEPVSFCCGSFFLRSYFLSFVRSLGATNQSQMTLADDDEAVLTQWRTSEQGDLEKVADSARGLFKTSEM